MPDYLVRHYWWAYLWRPSLWFFDHQGVINLILFGQYKKLLAATENLFEKYGGESTLQLACVYGRLTPVLLGKNAPDLMHIADVSQAQLVKVRQKVADDKRLVAARMNAESLAYRDSTFSRLIVFFLLHELPHEARRRTLSECLRVIASGGVLLLTEYQTKPQKNLLVRFPVTRKILTWLEPFLADFWREDLPSLLSELAAPMGKQVELLTHQRLFADFYQVCAFRITSQNG